MLKVELCGPNHPFWMLYYLLYAGDRARVEKVTKHIGTIMDVRESGDYESAEHIMAMMNLNSIFKEDEFRFVWEEDEHYVLMPIQRGVELMLTYPAAIYMTRTSLGERR